MTETALQRTVPASKAGMFAALEAAAGHLATQGVAPGLCSRAAVLLEEALMNVVMHGRRNDSAAGPLQMQLQVQVTAASVVLRMQDNGQPFDPLQAPPPRQDSLHDEAVQGGFGVHLLRKMASSLRYERQAGQNVLTLTLQR